jgi:hypothetical protein
VKEDGVLRLELLGEELGERSQEVLLLEEQQDVIVVFEKLQDVIVVEQQVSGPFLAGAEPFEVLYDAAVD